MSSGVFTELAAVGSIDKHLSHDTASQFVSNFRKSTHFASEFVKHSFQGYPHFGGSHQINVNRVGDLVGRVFLEVKLPAIMPVKMNGVYGGTRYPKSACVSCESEDAAAMVKHSRDPALVERYNANQPLTEADMQSMRMDWERMQHGASVGGCLPAEDCPCAEDGITHADNMYVHWTNAIGYALIEKVSFQIGGQTIDSQTSEYMYAYEELSGYSGKRIEEMVGRCSSFNSLVCMSSKPLHLFVPLHFFFCRTPSQYLPLASLQFHPVTFVFNFRRLTELINVSHDDVDVAMQKGGPLPQSFDGNLLIENVYLGTEERDAFATRSFENVVTVTQSKTVMRHNTIHVPVIIPFSLAIKYMIFLVRRHCHLKSNLFFNFAGVGGTDPLQSAKLALNNQERFDLSAKFLRLVEPYCKANNIPKSFVYFYSWSLSPFEVGTNTGSANFSRIDHASVELTLQPEVVEGADNTVDILIFAETYNVLRFSDGLGGLKFSS